MSWTEERIELLKKLWAEGLFASQIAEQLGGVTRNSVIGKARRLELEPHPNSYPNHSEKRAGAKPPRRPKKKNGPTQAEAIIYRIQERQRREGVAVLPTLEVIENPTPPRKRPRTRDEIIESGIKHFPRPQKGEYVDDPKEDLRYGAAMERIFRNLIDARVAK